MASIVNDNGNNHSFNTAQNVTINNVVSGSINALGEVDHYKITFDGNGEVEFILTAPETAEYALILYEGINNNASFSTRGYGSSDGEGHISLKYNVTAGTTYIVRITINGNNYSSNYAMYSLRFSPTVATNIRTSVSRTLIRYSDEVALTNYFEPTNAYRIEEVSQNNTNAIYNNGTITANTVGDTTFTVVDKYSSLSNSITVTSMPRPPICTEIASGFCYASCLQALDNMWGGTYTQYDSGIASDGTVMVNNSIVNTTEIVSNSLTNIKSALDQGNYCIVHFDGKFPHWVIAYYASSATTSGINVLDTYDGSYKTLARAIQYHQGTSVDKYRIASKKE